MTENASSYPKWQQEMRHLQKEREERRRKEMEEIERREREKAQEKERQQTEAMRQVMAYLGFDVEVTEPEIVLDNVRFTSANLQLKPAPEKPVEPTMDEIQKQIASRARSNFPLSAEEAHAAAKVRYEKELAEWQQQQAKYDALSLVEKTIRVSFVVGWDEAGEWFEAYQWANETDEWGYPNYRHDRMHKELGGTHINNAISPTEARQQVLLDMAEAIDQFKRTRDLMIADWKAWQEKERQKEERQAQREIEQEVTEWHNMQAKEENPLIEALTQPQPPTFSDFLTHILPSVNDKFIAALREYIDDIVEDAVEQAMLNYTGDY